MPEPGTQQLSSSARPLARVERAHVRDAEAIHRIVNFWAARGDMLPRTMGEVYENLRDFFVVREDGETVACGALHITWADMAELKSLAVSEDRQSAGYGSAITRACILPLPRYTERSAIPSQPTVPTSTAPPSLKGVMSEMTQSPGKWTNSCGRSGSARTSFCARWTDSPTPITRSRSSSSSA